MTIEILVELPSALRDDPLISTPLPFPVALVHVDRKARQHAGKTQSKQHECEKGRFEAHQRLQARVKRPVSTGR